MNHLNKYICFLASLFAILAFSSCEEENLPMSDTAERALHIRATMEGFTDPTTRATYKDYSMSFEKGDEIGVLGIVNGAVSSKVKNIKATYGESGWTTEQVIPYVAGATYIAYYPYNAKLKTSNVNSVDSIIQNSSKPSGGQSSLEEFKKYDLLVAETKSFMNDTLSFSFTHAFSMFEFVFPRIRYTMSNKAGTSALGDYYIPQSKNISFNKLKMFEATPNGYRCLVKPPNSKYTFTGTYEDADGATHKFTYVLDANALNAKGQCLRVNVDEETVINYQYEQGDFFLADGNLVPKDEGLTDEQKKQCIGIVVYLNSSRTPMGSTEKAVLAERGANAHGYVVALKNAENPGLQWGDVEELDGMTNSSSIASHLADISGLYNTRIMAAGLSSPNITDAVSTYTQSVPPPSHTTGWYIPSVGQWHHVVEKLTGEKIEAEDFDISWWSDGLSGEYTFTGEGFPKINNKFNNVGSEYADAINTNDYYWTSTGFINWQAGTVAFSRGEYCIYEKGRNHNDSGMKIRCFLAF